MKVKICGMTNADNLKSVLEEQPDLVGFIFYVDSPRYVDPENAVFKVPRCKEVRVGVFVNETVPQIKAVVTKCRLDAVQLHGHETPDFVKQVKLSLPNTLLIKALAVDSAESIQQAHFYVGLVDLLLFDTASAGYGGSGRSFNWDLLQHYKGSTPFFIGGGLHPENLKSLPQHEKLAGLDFGSRLESRPGLKQIDLVKRTIHFVRKEYSNDNQI